MPTIEIDQNMKAALAECVAYADRRQPYRFRRASMMKLSDLDLAKWLGGRAWYPTEKGRAYLVGLAAVHLTK